MNEHLRWLNLLEFKDWVPPALTFLVRHRQQPEAVLSFFRDLERQGYSMLARKTGVNDRIERFSALTNAVEAGAELPAATSPLQLSPEEQHQTYMALSGPLYETHSPRALALLSRKKNSSASNRDFAWKKSTYFTRGGTSAFALTTQVLQHADWTVEVMQQRQDAMLSRLEKHWRLQDRKSKAALAEALLAELEEAGEAVFFEMESTRHGLAAAAKEQGSVFTVLAGSQARRDWSGQPHPYQQLRNDLRNVGALKLSDDGTHLVFTADTPFKSPSAASATVLGRTDNGRNSWRLKGSAITYAAWQDNLPSSQPATGRSEG